VEQISRWKTQLRQQAEQIFVEPSPAVAAAPDIETLYATIGRLQMENQLLKKNAAARCIAQQRALVQASGEGSLQARCQALGLARSSYYYQPWGESAENLLLMRLLYEEFTDHNFKSVLGLCTTPQKLDSLAGVVKMYGYTWINEGCAKIWAGVWPRRLWCGRWLL
jgi:hypothetical protein